MSKESLATEKQIDRFWTKLRLAPNGCFEFTGELRNDGYGQYGVGEPTANSRTTVTTHRLAYHLTYGEIKDGLFVCHHCDNRKCCNPSHLFLGTNQDNMQDMIRKGRRVIPSRLGSKNGRAVLTEEIVALIRSDEDMSCAEIARTYGLSKSQAHRIKTGDAWPHVKGYDSCKIIYQTPSD